MSWPRIAWVSSRTAWAGADSGTICSTPFLVRESRRTIFQPSGSFSISLQRNEPISSRRQAVRMRSRTILSKGSLAQASHILASSSFLRFGVGGFSLFMFVLLFGLSLQLALGIVQLLDVVRAF